VFWGAADFGGVEVGRVIFREDFSFRHDEGARGEGETGSRLVSLGCEGESEQTWSARVTVAGACH